MFYVQRPSHNLTREFIHCRTNNSHAPRPKPYWYPAPFIDHDIVSPPSTVSIVSMFHDNGFVSKVLYRPCLVLFCFQTNTSTSTLSRHPALLHFGLAPFISYCSWLLIHLHNPVSSLLFPKQHLCGQSHHIIINFRLIQQWLSTVPTSLRHHDPFQSTSINQALPR